MLSSPPEQESGRAELVASRPARVGWFASSITWFRTLLFGYDFFICYRTADASKFARALYDRLKAARFDCFLDVRHYEAGHNLPRMQSEALRRSTKLLVLVSPRAHLGPERGTDWVLAEVREFTDIARRRGRAPKIVPVGNAATLDPVRYPDSKLLPEIPKPNDNTVCVFDDAIERNGEPSAATLEKLKNDFTEARRRTMRLATAAMALVLIAGAVGLSLFSFSKRHEAQQEAEFVATLRTIDRGRDQLASGRADDASSQSATAGESFLAAANKLRALGKDSLIARHGQFAVELSRLPARPIASVGREASYLLPSADGNWMLVVFDHQTPANPDLDPKATAFAVVDLQKRVRTLEKRLSAKIGEEIYLLGRDSLLAFEPPHYVIVQDGTSEPKKYVKVSLVDGTRTEVGAPNAPRPAGQSPDLSAAIDALLPPSLNRSARGNTPREGSQGYEPRQIDEIRLQSPNGQTAIVGTPGGRLVLVDLDAKVRREFKKDVIYAAAYRPDGQRAYFCDSDKLWEIETGVWPGIREMQLSLRKNSVGTSPHEVVLEAALADDASACALVTTDRLFCYNTATGKSREWPLPHRMEKVAALRVDRSRSRVDVVAADDGTIVSVRYDLAPSSPDVVPRPGGPMPSVAWLDSQPPSVWLAGLNAEKGAVDVYGVALPDETAALRSIPKVGLRSDDSLLGIDSLRVHAIAKRDGRLVLFHGDDTSYREDRTLLDEEVTVLSLEAKTPPAHHVIFTPTNQNLTVVVTYNCNQVDRVLPVTLGNALLAGVGPLLYAVDFDGHTTDYFNGLFAMVHEDGRESYKVGLVAGENSLSVEVTHERTGTSFSYPLPWSAPTAPTFGAIAPGGRRGVIADGDGHILFFDIDGGIRTTPKQVQ